MCHCCGLWNMHWRQQCASCIWPRRLQPPPPPPPSSLPTPSPQLVAFNNASTTPSRIPPLPPGEPTPQFANLEQMSSITGMHVASTDEGVKRVQRLAHAMARQREVETMNRAQAAFEVGRTSGIAFTFTPTRGESGCTADAGIALDPNDQWMHAQPLPNDQWMHAQQLPNDQWVHTPQSIGDRHGIRPGDWTCPSCYRNVFASRVACFNCLTPRPRETPPVGASPMAQVAMPAPHMTHSNPMDDDSEDKELIAAIAASLGAQSTSSPPAPSNTWEAGELRWALEASLASTSGGGAIAQEDTPTMVSTPLARLSHAAGVPSASAPDGALLMDASADGDEDMAPVEDIFKCLVLAMDVTTCRDALLAALPLSHIPIIATEITAVRERLRAHKKAAAAAALAASNATGAAKAAKAAADARAAEVRTVPATPSALNECIVCEDAERTICFVPCGHKALCVTCAENWEATGLRASLDGKCPICRRGFDRIIHISYG